ncbi:elongation factor P [Candidatus Beckwithbacteria bacterium CG10_big_fil_rev_8_21_14_0_10_34_10]|uniref:Elongation factor P n=1 Tax=Candidatus Beckwithbacteria bacterium CG10_big_fil_rev_8_21_14_0_10_34_10 TaxID=1974495 RepID=A0A2H0W925_9BACT|nr:MAG: elongation factor P [Candidatus Beckwithbacteria bacterium CG10_big_fil_rev_8_21_14_0_10_34_10]
MLNATQLKNNTCFLYQGKPFKVLDYKHTHLSRRGADIKVKAKNLIFGNVLNLNFGSNDRFEEALIEKRKLQYLYCDQESYFFMDPKTYDQVEISLKIIGSQGKFLNEGDQVNLFFFEGKAIDLDLPLSIIVEISSCDPGVKGNSAANLLKNAETKNGLKIKVPLFIKVGDKVKVDTRTSEYHERVK